jgi:hypothetical protein
MGKACNTHEGNKKCTQTFDTLKKRHNLEDLGFDGRMVLKKILEKQVVRN